MNTEIKKENINFITDLKTFNTAVLKLVTEGSDFKFRFELDEQDIATEYCFADLDTESKTLKIKLNIFGLYFKERLEIMNAVEKLQERLEEHYNLKQESFSYIAHDAYIENDTFFDHVEVSLVYTIKENTGGNNEEEN